MPVYEYFCPRCYRELEVLRPIHSAGEYSECPDCGGKAWRLVSGFGSRTGSYLQPSGMPFRDESASQASGSAIAAAVAKDDVSIRPSADEEQALPTVGMSWLLESQPNGSNIWFVQDWGIASILRYVRENLELEVAKTDSMPVEAPVVPEPVVDQRIEYSSVRPCPDERAAGPAMAAKSDAGPAVAVTKPRAPSRAVGRSSATARVTRPAVRPSRVPARNRTPRSYFGWFVLTLASISVIVVLVVWILTMAA